MFWRVTLAQLTIRMGLSLHQAESHQDWQIVSMTGMIHSSLTSIILPIKMMY